MHLFFSFAFKEDIVIYFLTEIMYFLTLQINYFRLTSMIMSNIVLSRLEFLGWDINSTEKTSS